MSATTMGSNPSGAPGYTTSMGPRSPSSSVCSFAGSVNSEIMQPNKYLMKTLCLSKKSSSLPGKAEYANLLTCGLGARKWVASLEFDADSFKAAIVNIYPRLATVPSYTLWNVKPDKTFEKLPCTVNTPKRIKAYLGASFTGSLVIMPSEEISLGPVKVPMTRNYNREVPSSSSSRSVRTTSSKDEKESGYDSYQESISSRDQKYSYGLPSTPSSSSSSSSHKLQHLNSLITGRSHRHICLTCGRLAKQVGSTSFYDIHNTTTFATSDGYVSIAKKLRDLFHLELPRSKIIASDQICRKCFRALNEIHFLETQLKRSKEEMISTLFATVGKISKLEQMARDASASSSSDSSSSSLGTLMSAAALNPWFQEARYILEQQRAVAAAAVATANHMDHKPRGESGRSNENSHSQAHSPQEREPSPTKTASAVAIFPGQAGEAGHYVDYRSPQPVLLAPLAGFSTSAPGGPRPRSQSPHERGQPPPIAVPINMSLMSARSQDRDSGSPPYSKNSIQVSSPTIYLGKSTHYFTQSRMGEERERRPNVEREAIEERMAAEEEADAKEAAERDHAAYMEEAYNCRRRLEATDEKPNGPPGGGNCSSSSRSSSVIGNNSSPDSQSPSPPTTSSTNGGSDTTNTSNGECEVTESKKYEKIHEATCMRRPWKKRYHEITNQDHHDTDEQTETDIKRARMLKKRGSGEVPTEPGPGLSEPGCSNDTKDHIEEDLISNTSSISPNSDKNKN